MSNLTCPDSTGVLTCSQSRHHVFTSESALTRSHQTTRVISRDFAHSITCATGGKRGGDPGTEDQLWGTIGQHRGRAIGTLDPLPPTAKVFGGPAVCFQARQATFRGGGVSYVSGSSRTRQLCVQTVTLISAEHCTPVAEGTGWRAAPAEAELR
eukprot:2786826-Rhodomonas_salina.2